MKDAVWWGSTSESEGGDDSESAAFIQTHPHDVDFLEPAILKCRRGRAAKLSPKPLGLLREVGRQRKGVKEGGGIVVGRAPEQRVSKRSEGLLSCRHQTQSAYDNLIE